jgi:hypothetical protein
MQLPVEQTRQPFDLPSAPAVWLQVRPLAFWATQVPPAPQ